MDKWLEQDLPSMYTIQGAWFAFRSNHQALPTSFYFMYMYFMVFY